MKFFVPSVGTAIQESVYHSIKKKCQEYVSMPISEERIYSVDFNKTDKKYTATVGETLELNNDKVFAIFSTLEDPSTLLIATQKEGGQEGKPLQISMLNTTHVDEFDIHSY